MGDNVGQLINVRGALSFSVLGMENSGLLFPGKDADTHFESVGLGLGESMFSERVCMSIKIHCLNSPHNVYDM